MCTKVRITVNGEPGINIKDTETLRKYLTGDEIVEIKKETIKSLLQLEHPATVNAVIDTVAECHFEEVTTNIVKTNTFKST